MTMRSKEEIDRFVAMDEEGNEYIIICLQTITKSQSLDGKFSITKGTKELRLENGEPVNFVDAETYKIVTTDKILKKIT
jgi:hypothetical protein